MKIVNGVNIRKIQVIVVMFLKKEIKMKADFEKGTKVCNKCKKELPISEFYKNKSAKDGK